MKSQAYNVVNVAMAMKQHEKEQELEHHKRKQEFMQKHGVKIKTNKPYTALEQ